MLGVLVGCYVVILLVATWICVTRRNFEASHLVEVSGSRDHCLMTVLTPCSLSMNRRLYAVNGGPLFSFAEHYARPLCEKVAI